MLAVRYVGVWNIGQLPVCLTACLECVERKGMALATHTRHGTVVCELEGRATGSCHLSVSINAQVAIQRQALNIHMWFCVSERKVINTCLYWNKTNLVTIVWTLRH